MSEPPALACTGLSRHHGDLVALAPLDLQVRGPAVVALVGHNGSGKSTLLRLLSGAWEPTEGEATVHGEPAGSLAARRLLAHVPDAPVLYDDLSVAEHVEYLGALSQVDDPVGRGAELLERLGLTARADDLPRDLSRGLRQRVALTLALLRDTPVLLVDEPFVGLDAAGRRGLLELLAERRDDGATVVVATHDPLLLGVADRAVVLADGHVIQDGRAGDVAREHLVG